MFYEKWKKHGMKDTDKARNKEKEKESCRNDMKHSKKQEDEQTNYDST